MAFLRVFAVTLIVADGTVILFDRAEGFEAIAQFMQTAREPNDE
jgi:hypothetical protein